MTKEELRASLDAMFPSVPAVLLDEIATSMFEAVKDLKDLVVMNPEAAEALGLPQVARLIRERDRILAERRRSASVKQEVPEIRDVDRNTDAMGRRLIAAPVGGYDVYSWSPGKAGEGVPPTQVHLVLPVIDDASVVLRLKSARALDELVGVLLQHRRDVWGSTERTGKP